MTSSNLRHWHHSSMTRLSLRPLRYPDWTRIHEWAQREDVSRYQPWGPNTPEQTRAFVEDTLAAETRHPRTQYVLCAVDDAGTVVGIADISVRSFEDRRAEIGYAVHHELWGRGYGTQIATLAIDLAFTDLGMHRVEATCDPLNVASAAVLRKLMTYEGRRREDKRLRDRWRDSEMFGVLEQEWRA